MRIRKPSIEISWPTSSEKAGSSPSIGHGDNDEDFLLPLLAAAMDVEAKAGSKLQRDATASPAPVPQFPEIGVQKRSARNWRNALLGLNEDSEEIEVRQECHQSNYRCDGIMSRNRKDNFQCLTSQGRDRKLELPKSDASQKRFMSRKREREQDLCVKKKRSIVESATECNVIGPIITERKGYAVTIFENDKNKTKKKPQAKEQNNNNHYHGVSQCRRRNGRGWRCSQRTLVGYSLCEHHLGKGRLQSINTSEFPIAANKKGVKFKKLHLIQAATCKNDL